MQTQEETKPIEDTVAKVDNDLAVGSDIEFQRKWWRFTRFIWILFFFIVVADVLGAFGRGPLANAELQSPDGSVKLKYERVERFSTPSIMTVEFNAAVIHEGKIQLRVSEDLVKPLGNQRIIPQPLTSVLESSGILYTFSAANAPATVEFALEPAKPGVFSLTLQVPGYAAIKPRIYVMP